MVLYLHFRDAKKTTATDGTSSTTKDKKSVDPASVVNKSSKKKAKRPGDKQRKEPPREDLPLSFQQAFGGESISCAPATLKNDALNPRPYAEVERKESNSPDLKNGQQSKKPELKLLKPFEEMQVNDDPCVKVVFHVLRSHNMMFPDSTMYIVFGPPLSDWVTPLVAMHAIDVGTE